MERLLHESSDLLGLLLVMRGARTGRGIAGALAVGCSVRRCEYMRTDEIAAASAGACFVRGATCVFRICLDKQSCIFATLA